MTQLISNYKGNKYKDTHQEVTTKNDENSGKLSRNHPRKRLGSITEAPRLAFSSWKQFFSLISSES